MSNRLKDFAGGLSRVAIGVVVLVLLGRLVGMSWSDLRGHLVSWGVIAVSGLTYEWWQKGNSRPAVALRARSEARLAARRARRAQR